MCNKFLLRIINIELFDFIRNITPLQQKMYVFIGLITAMIALNFFSDIYHLTGVLKLLVYFIFILFFIGGIINGLKIVGDNLGDFQNKYIATYYCFHIIGFLGALILFIFKFLKLTFFLIFG